MRNNLARVALAVLAASYALSGGLPGMAQEEKAGEATAPKADAIPEAISFISSQSGRFGGQSVDYRTIAGETYLKDAAGEPTGSIFSYSYIREGVSDVSTRPVLFIFNGGPGSASLWLHMGAFGPKRVVVPSDAGQAGAPPYPVVDNAETLLDIADLVFIDPIGTGYSRPLGDTDAKIFYGITEDASAIAQFVRIWIREHGRWNSPKYLIGESYGTMRAAAMANQMELSSPTVSLNGLVLISDFQQLEGVTFQPGNELGNIGFLPSYAAVAWYHHKAGGGADLADWVAKAREFALGPYATALLQGNRLSADERAALIPELADFTGLSEDYIDKANLRINYRRFRRQLMRDEGKVLGGLDARYLGEDVDAAGELATGDAASSAIGGAYYAAINDYMTRTLGMTMDRPYVVSGQVSAQWNWTLPNWQSLLGDPLSYNTGPYVGRAMRQNKDLRVMVASGYFDLVTPFFDAENSFARNGILPERMTYKYYEAGHMMYVHEPSRVKLLNDVRAFISVQN